MSVFNPIFREPVFEEWVEEEIDEEQEQATSLVTNKRTTSYTPGKRRRRRLYRITQELFCRTPEKRGYVTYSPNYCDGAPRYRNEGQ